MTTLSNRLSVEARERIIQAQEPVPANSEHALYTLCEVIAREENWYAYYRKQENITAAERTATFLNDKRAMLRVMLHGLVIPQNFESVLSSSAQ